VKTIVEVSDDLAFSFHTIVLPRTLSIIIGGHFFCCIDLPITWLFVFYLVIYYLLPIF
jgi:hypothetical protein